MLEDTAEAGLVGGDAGGELVFEDLPGFQMAIPESDVDGSDLEVSPSFSADAMFGGCLVGRAFVLGSVKVLGSLMHSVC